MHSHKINYCTLNEGDMLLYEVLENIKREK